MTRAEILREWYDRVWEQGDLDAIGELFAPSTMAEGLIPEMQVGVDDFRDFVMAFQQLVGDMKVDLPLVIEHGDWVSAVVRIHTSRADNGAPVEVTGQVMARVAGGKMTEAYNQVDFISLFEQLGQFPADTLPISMTGQRLDFA